MKKLLICITYHFVESRLSYLKKVLDNLLNNYKTNNTIIIETNTKITHDFLSEYKQIHVKVNENLDHPHKLAWCHRKTILNKIDDFDYFYYTEDDILLPYENFLSYFDKFDYLWEKGFIPSFVRIEKDNTGQTYNTDAFFPTKVPEDEILLLDNKRYITLDNPYHGFWLMPQKQLKTNIHKFSLHTKEKKWIREIAASFGIKPGTCPYACWKSNDLQKKSLIEINKENKVDSSCWSYHLPNNYYNNYQFRYGKIPLEEIVKVFSRKILL